MIYNGPEVGYTREKSKHSRYSMKKRIIPLLLALALVLTGCGGGIAASPKERSIWVFD